MTPATAQPPTKSSNASLIVLCVLAALVLALPAVVLAGVLVYLLKTHPRSRVVLALLALVGCAVLYAWHRHIMVMLSVMTEILSLSWRDIYYLFWNMWSRTWPAAPVLALAFDVLRPRSAEEQLTEQQQQRDARDQRQSQAARAKATHAPEVIKGNGVVGRVVSGDLPWSQGGWMTYPAAYLSRHAVLVGGSGSGKTETALRIAQIAAKHYGWQVFFLDFKGDGQTAIRFRAAMEQAGHYKQFTFPALALDCWRGEPGALVNRLMAVTDYSEPYYRDVCKRVLWLACSAPGGPPRNSGELLDRLTKERLAELYAGRRETDEIRGFRPDDIRGVLMRFSAFFGLLEGKTDGRYSFEDADSGYVLVDGTSLKEEAASLGRLLLEDFSHYCARRKPADRQLLCIIDEYSAISQGGADAANLLERLRSFGAAVIVSSQSYAGLGEDADRMLDAAATLILHASADPEKLAARGGTRKQAETGYQISEGQTTGMATMRMQDAFKVSPNAVRRLEQGECFVINGGKAARMQVSRLGIAAEHMQLAAQSLGDRPGTIRATDGEIMVQPYEPEPSIPFVQPKPTPQPEPARTLNDSLDVLPDSL